MRIQSAKADLGKGAGVLPIFCNRLLFCKHFEELQFVLFEVKLIINNTP